jgi:UDP-glucose 4-epimerase
VLGTINLLRQPGLKHFILASTGGAMYSTPKQWPASEQTESLTPISAYGISKAMAELAQVRYAIMQGMQWITLRYSNVYGPRQNSHGESGVMAIFSELAVQGKQPVIYNKDATRDYIFVGDVVNANLRAVTGLQGIYNISTGIETTNQQVFEAVAAEFDWKVKPKYEPARPGELVRSVLDNTKAVKQLKWKPVVGIKEGLRRIHDVQAH